MAALELVVTAEQAGRTVKSLLRGELGLSAGRVGRLKRTETGLTVNGRRVFVTALLRAGDRLRVDLDAAERQCMQYRDRRAFGGDCAGGAGSLWCAYVYPGWYQRGNGAGSDGRRPGYCHGSSPDGRNQQGVCSVGSACGGGF